MSNFDVRTTQESIDRIIFAARITTKHSSQGYFIQKWSRGTCEGIIIADETYDDDDGGEGYVIIESMQDALNLKKALDKAAELGWLD